MCSLRANESGMHCESNVTGVLLPNCYQKMSWHRRSGYDKSRKPFGLRLLC